MFKSLAEKKQQLDKMLSLQKAIKDLEVYSEWDFSEVYINSQFEVVDICFNPDWSWIDEVENDLKVTINKAIKKMQELIQKKSKEIFKYKKKES